MNYKLIALQTERDDPYPPEFLDSLTVHELLGWNLVFIAFEGDNPMVLFQRQA